MEVVVVRDEKVCGVNARWKNGCKEGNGETVRKMGEKRMVIGGVVVGKGHRRCGHR